MSYESPIEMFTEQVSNYWSEKTDDLVMKAVMNVGVEVDKDELVKALAYDRDQYEKGFHDGMMANKWVPTSERLPEVYERVIVTLRSNLVNFASIIYGENNEMQWLVGSHSIFRFYSVVAWMPLPKPYEEEENG